MQPWFLCLWTVIALYLCTPVQGHGYLLMPPGRSSAWRVNNTAFHTNYNDNANYCGGFGVQHNEFNRGRCGICGDDFSLPQPRDNELGGYFDTGNIVAEYQSGGIIVAAVVITANHKGNFTFQLCRGRYGKKWETEKCFDTTLEDDKTKLNFFRLPNGKPDTFRVALRIPEYIKCDRCVLRWKYQTANSWGCVDDNRPRTCCVGCGNKQEYFYSCADIKISASGNEGYPEWKPIDRTKTTTPRPTTTRYPSSTSTMKTTTTRRTRRPIRTTRPVRPTRSTTTTTENPVCVVFCSKVCKRGFNEFCTTKLCRDCYQFRSLLVD